MKKLSKYDYYICPHCGEEVRVGSTCCPHCGPDKSGGWSAEFHEDDPDFIGGYSGNDDFDYKSYLEREFGEFQQGGRFTKIRLKRILFLLTVGLLMVSLLSLYVFGI